MVKEASSPSTSPGRPPPRLLLVDDDASMCEMLEHDLSARGYQVTWCTTLDEARAHAVAGAPWDVVVTDLNLRAGSGLDLCQHLAAQDADLPVVVITAFGSIESAIKATRLGAYDFITKPFEFDTLALTLARAVAHRALKAEVAALRQQVAAQPPRFTGLLGESPPMLELFRRMERAADSTATVLITGESGVGKELVARALHQQGRRSTGPFVALNCGAIPESLLESELFGHVRGAFTDARTDRLGVFREAQGGTLFLDEVGELPVALQPRLLRVLQERRVRPVGSDQEVAVDARIVCATNVDLRLAVEEGRFREDLYYRLDVVHLEVPPLHRRGKDVLLLAHAFLATIAQREGRPVPQLSHEATERLLAWEWPGNVRELLNCLERAMALSPGDTIRLHDLPDRIARMTPMVIPDPTEPATILTLEEMEKRYILRVLALNKGNKRRTAEQLKVDRSTLYRKLQQYGEPA